MIGIGLSSDDFAADTAWGGDPGAWIMPEQQGFPNAAGRHEHQNDFYVFVMNRMNGDDAKTSTTRHLRCVTTAAGTS